MASSTVGTKFYYYTTGQTPTATQIKGMITKPAMKTIPARIDSTSQEEEEATSVSGVRQTGDQNFQFKHTDGNYALFLTLEGTQTKFGVAYPDGKSVEWEAVPYVQRDGTGVNALDTFTVAMFPQTAATEVTTPVGIA